MWEATGGGHIFKEMSRFRTSERPSPTARVKGGRQHEGHNDKKIPTLLI